jgi:hypothetical protein
MYGVPSSSMKIELSYPRGPVTELVFTSTGSVHGPAGEPDLQNHCPLEEKYIQYDP